MTELERLLKAIVEIEGQIATLTEEAKGLRELLRSAMLSTGTPRVECEGYVASLSKVPQTFVCADFQKFLQRAGVNYLEPTSRSMRKLMRDNPGLFHSLLEEGVIEAPDREKEWKVVIRGVQKRVESDDEADLPNA